MLLGNDVDDAGHRVATVERTLRPLHNLNLLNVLRVNQAEVVLAAHVAMNALAVDEYQYVVVAQAVELHLTAHVALAEGERCRQSCQDFLQTLAAIAVEHPAGDDLRLYGRILQQMPGTSTRHHHFLQTIGAPYRLTLHTDNQQPKAKSQFLS